MSAVLLLAVAVANGTGSALRLLVDSLLAHATAGRRFPVGTSVINITGSFALGLVTGLALGGHLAPEAADVLVTTSLFLSASWLRSPASPSSRQGGTTAKGEGAPLAPVASFTRPEWRRVWPEVHPSRQRDRQRVHGLDLAPVPHDESRPPFRPLVVASQTWPTAVVMVRRQTLDTVELFEAGLTQREDWDLYLRCS